jgi:hypothetical protein
VSDERPALKEVFDSPQALRDFLVAHKVFEAKPAGEVEQALIDIYNNENLRLSPVDSAVERFLRNQPGNPKKILLGIAKLGILRMYYDKRIRDVQIVMTPEAAAVIEQLMNA